MERDQQLFPEPDAPAREAVDTHKAADDISRAMADRPVEYDDRTTDQARYGQGHRPNVPSFSERGAAHVQAVRKVMDAAADGQEERFKDVDIN
jgi:hypothetical protein